MRDSASVGRRMWETRISRVEEDALQVMERRWLLVRWVVIIDGGVATTRVGLMKLEVAKDVFTDNLLVVADGVAMLLVMCCTWREI